MNESSDSGPSSPPLPAGSGAASLPVAPAAAAGVVFLQNPNRYPGVDLARLAPWLEGVVAALAPAAGSLAVRFCGDRAMRQANRDYRALDKTTDVLSFPGDLPPLPAAALGQQPRAQGRGRPGEAPPPVFAPPPGDHLGDLLVSVPQASRQAAELGHPLDVELRVLLLHGVLHCLGYDHEVDDGTMNRVEAELRRRFVGEIGFIEGSES